MSPRTLEHLRLGVGSCILAAALVGLILLLGSPSVAGPTGRIAASLASGLDAEREGDLVLDARTLDGVHVGDPVYLEAADATKRPVAHVVAIHPGEAGAAHRVRLRIEDALPGASGYRLKVFAPSRRLGDAVTLAVPRDVRRELGVALLGRVRTLWDEALAPEVKRRMPAFLARIDPTGDTQARKTLTALGDTMLVHLQPHLDGLMGHVSKKVDRHFDLLDRMGLLWKFVRGDAKGLKKEVLPVAQKAAENWWAANQNAVVASVGAAVKARLPELQAWVEGELLDAAREELLEPLLESQLERLEQEGEAVARVLLKRIVESPEGGFRVRFAGMLRHVLLGKRTALLLLAPLDTGDA